MIFLLEKTIEINILFDYYGEMLTEKQQEAMKLYYYHDLSLAEIAEKLDISRQGVYDHLHRGEDILREYESKISLVERYNKFREKLDELLVTIDELEIDESKSEELKREIKNLENYL
ncbi:MAG: YlxM family DNA-binding protein [Bacillota bacterium]